MKELLKVGNVVDDGTGDYLREGGLKLNNNFNEVYSELGDGVVPFPAGAWETISSLTGNTFAANFGKSYAVNTTAASMTINLPKGSSADYNKVIKIRDVFSTWQLHPVTIVPATGDTLKGSSDAKVFSRNLSDLELVYCAPGKWEYLANRQINRITGDDTSTVMKQEYICTEGQTDFLNVFGDNEYNKNNIQVYMRGNLLYYGKEFSDDSDFGSPGTGSDVIPLDGKSIRLRDPAELGDSLIVITYTDGVAQWRSTYNRLDCVVLSSNKTIDTSVAGEKIVADLSTFVTVTPLQMGYTPTSNSGLINPQTLEVYLNGVILNEAGTAGIPLMFCDGANASNASDCALMGGEWKQSNIDYTYETGDDGAIDSITFGKLFEHGDIITLKWFNNNIGTTLELDDITDTTDELYISRGSTYQLTGDIRVTDYDNPTLPNTESIPTHDVLVQSPNELFSLIYPIGTIYENAINPNNPSTYMGFGTWKLFGEARMTVGWTPDTADAQFCLNDNYKDSNGKATATAGGTGGGRTVTLSNNEIPASKSEEKVLVADPNGAVVIGGCQYDPEESGPAYNKYSEEAININSANTPPKSINILPPYITVYRWMRIA